MGVMGEEEEADKGQICSKYVTYLMKMELKLLTVWNEYKTIKLSNQGPTKPAQLVKGLVFMPFHSWYSHMLSFDYYTFIVICTQASTSPQNTQKI